MSHAGGSIRIGPISIFSLVILLCLSVLCVLAITTAEATYATAQKHASFTDATYTNEVEAQKFIAALDTRLAPIREGRSSSDPLETVKDILPANARLEDGIVFAEFVSDGGRTLAIAVAIDTDARYSVLEWRASTQWNPDTGNQQLWSGSTPQP